MHLSGIHSIRKALGASGRFAAHAALMLGALGVLGACETQAPYAACELDSEVTKKGICASSKTGGDTSCVVKSHPHCDLGICLSYFSKKPFCSIPCVKDSDPVCGSDAFCWSYKEETDGSGKVISDERYCVLNEQKIVVKK